MFIYLQIPICIGSRSITKTTLAVTTSIGGGGAVYVRRRRDVPFPCQQNAKNIPPRAQKSTYMMSYIFGVDDDNDVARRQCVALRIHRVCCIICVCVLYMCSCLYILADACMCM